MLKLSSNSLFILIKQALGRIRVGQQGQNFSDSVYCCHPSEQWHRPKGTYDSHHVVPFDVVLVCCAPPDFCNLSKTNG